MKNKGFTLVELLAVIAILGILATIAVPSAFSFGNKIKKNMYCEKVSMVLTEAKRWGNDHLSSLQTNCYIEKTVGDLVLEGMLKKEQDVVGSYILNPYSNNPMDPIKIKIYVMNKRAAAYYAEVDPELVNLCDANTDHAPSIKC